MRVVRFDDEFLLKDNITVEDVAFRLRGEAGVLDGPGLGVSISSQRLNRLSTDSVSITRLKA